MVKVEIVMEELKAGAGCARVACDSPIDRRWAVLMQITDARAHAFGSVPPIRRQFSGCDRHIFPVAQYLIGEVLLADALREASAMKPQAIG